MRKRWVAAGLIVLAVVAVAVLNGLFEWELLYKTTGIYIPNPLAGVL